MMPALVARNRIVAASRPTYSSPARLQRPEIDLLDEAEDRVAGEAALLLGEPEQREVRRPSARCCTGSADSATAGSVK